MPDVDVKGVGTVSFPDGMSPDDIQATLRRHFGGKQGGDVQNLNKTPEPLPGQSYRDVTQPWSLARLLAMPKEIGRVGLEQFVSENYPEPLTTEGLYYQPNRIINRLAGLVGLRSNLPEQSHGESLWPFPVLEDHPTPYELEHEPGYSWIKDIYDKYGHTPKAAELIAAEHAKMERWPDGGDSSRVIGVMMPGLGGAGILPLPTKNPLPTPTGDLPEAVKIPAQILAGLSQEGRQLAKPENVALAPLLGPEAGLTGDVAKTLLAGQMALGAGQNLTTLPERARQLGSQPGSDYGDLARMLTQEAVEDALMPVAGAELLKPKATPSSGLAGSDIQGLKPTEFVGPHAVQDIQFMMPRKPRFVVTPGRSSVDVRQMTAEDMTRLFAKDKPSPMFDNPVLGEQVVPRFPLREQARPPVSVSSELEGANKPEPLGGQVSFNAPAEARAIPSARQAGFPRDFTPEEQQLIANLRAEQAQRGQVAPVSGPYQRPTIPPSRAEWEKSQAKRSVVEGLTIPEQPASVEPSIEAPTITDELRGKPLSNLQLSRLRIAVARGASDEVLKNIMRFPEGSRLRMTEGPRKLYSGIPLADDFDQYQEITKRGFEALRGGGLPNQADWKAMEVIKNKYNGMPPTAPPSGETLAKQLVPAILLDNGKVIKADRASQVTHRDVLAANGESEESYPHESEARGFVDEAGRWYTRKQAEQRTGLKGTAAAGGLDSMDLPRAKGQTDESLRRVSQEGTSQDARTTGETLRPGKEGQGQEGEGQVKEKDDAQERGRLLSGIPLFDSDLMARTKEVFGALRTGHFNQERAAQLLDAADSKARIQGQQLGHRIAVGLKHNDVADRALTFVAEAGGSARKLQAFAEQIRGKNKQAEEAVQYAQENLDSLRPHSIELAKQLEKERQAEQALGIETDRLNDYMKHAYRADDVGLFDIGPGGSGVSTSFLKDRSYPDYATAIANGETPKDLRASKLLDSRVAAGQRLANRVVWGQQLKELKTASGEGFAADFVKKGGRWTAPSGYVTKELAPGVRVPIHDDYARFIDALTAPSFLRQSKAGSAALGIEAGLKHGLLIFDSYHAFRMMRKELFLSKKIAYENALSVLEYDKPTVARLVKQGDLKPEAAKWIEENRPKAELLVRNGLNVGRLSEALYAEVMRKEVKVKGVDINLPGRFNRWVFEKLTRGAMLQSALLELGKVKKAHPTWTDEQAASYIAKQMNVYYGNLQRQGLFKSESARDSLQLAFLAPQWVESMVQSEARGYGQLAKAPADAVRRRPIAPLGKALASGVVAYLVANQIINMATTGHPTWENKEDGRKFDAKLHGGYWLSPMNDVAEVTHDYYRYMNQGKGAVESTAQIAANKLSPVGRAASVLFQGRDYAGAKLSDKERLEEATKAMIPTPLPLSGLQSEVPKQGGRQAYSTLGFKVEPDYRQHEEALEKVSGKRFEDLTLDERVEAEQKYQEGRPPMSARQKQDAKQKSLDAQARRERETTGEFSKADRQWMDSRGLVLPSYDDKLALGKTKVYLTKEEQAKLKSLVFEEYKAVLDDLRSDESFDSMDRTERQQLFRVQMNAASRRARVRLQEELDRPVQKMNKTPGPFRSLP